MALNLRHVWFCATLLFSSHASTATIEGDLTAFLAQRLYAPQELDHGGARLGLSANGKLGARTSYTASLDIEANAASSSSDRETGVRIYPEEMFLNIANPKADLRVGQQYVFWGRIPWVSPLDVVTPWNYKRMDGELQDDRAAPPGVVLESYLDRERTVELVWLPLFSPNRPAPNDALPAKTLENSEFGVRMSQTLSALALDWSVYAYSGFGKNLVADAGGPRFTRLRMLGGDFAKAAGPFVFTTELASKWLDYIGLRAEALAGLDFSASPELKVSGQYLISSGGAGDDRVGQQVSFTTERRLGPLFKLDVIGIYNLLDGDRLALAFIRWDLAGALSVRLGGVVFGGDRNGLFGRLESRSQILFETRYVF